MAATVPYRPSNGTEGEIFMSRFCARCKRDAKFQETQDAEDGCPILADSFFYGIDDPKYPKEWIIDPDAPPMWANQRGAPRCTAFEPIDAIGGSK